MEAFWPKSCMCMNGKPCMHGLPLATSTIRAFLAPQVARRKRWPSPVRISSGRHSGCPAPTPLARWNLSGLEEVHDVGSGKLGTLFRIAHFTCVCAEVACTIRTARQALRRRLLDVAALQFERRCGQDSFSTVSS